VKRNKGELKNFPEKSLPMYRKGGVNQGGRTPGGGNSNLSRQGERLVVKSFIFLGKQNSKEKEKIKMTKGERGWGQNYL